MHLFHKWSKWDSGVKTTTWEDGTKSDFPIQFRRCQTCGKWQVERMDV